MNSGSLDSITADHIFDVFEHLVSEQNKTIIMVTHDMGLVSRFSRHLTIADGDLIELTESDSQLDKTLARRRR